jgi:hypothetical protein
MQTVADGSSGSAEGAERNTFQHALNSQVHRSTRTVEDGSSGSAEADCDTFQHAFNSEDGSAAEPSAEPLLLLRVHSPALLSQPQHQLNCSVVSGSGMASNLNSLREGLILSLEEPQTPTGGKRTIWMTI